MSFGFPAYSTASRRFDLGRQDLVGVVRESLDGLGWRYETPAPDQFVARNSVNLWSWGEKISVEVGGDGTVTARSECLLATQCFDWGKNKRNVKAFFDEVERTARERAPRLQVAPHDDEGLTPVERVIKEDPREKL